MIENISVVMIVKNGEKSIKESLLSLKEFKEVIIYLNNSTDRTEEIAKGFSNVKIVKGEFLGFGKTKNRASSFAKNSWILSLDSDESLTDELIEEIKSLNLKEKNRVYAIKRKNLFLGKWVKHSGWNPDFVIRLYNRDFTSFNKNLVHESIIKRDAKVVELNNYIIHRAIEDIGEFLEKVNRYSSLNRENMRKLSPFTIFLRASFAFFKTYFLRLGFLDGYRGLVIAVSNFNGVFFKYIKFYAKSDN